MKKYYSLLITLLFAIQSVLFVLTSRLHLKYLDYNFGTLMFAVTFIISIAFVMIMWKAEEKYQNIVFFASIIAFVLSFKLQIGLVVTIIGIRTFNRYTSTKLTNVMKGIALVFVVLSLASVMFLPAVASGYQERGYNVYKTLVSEDGDHVLMINNYDVSTYGMSGQVELSFNKRVLGIYRSEITEIPVSYQLDLTYEWLDNNAIRVYDVIYTFADDQIKVGK